MNQIEATLEGDPFEITRPQGASAVVLICEHASAFIPEHYDHLGLAADDRNSHAAWDPGAKGVALQMSQDLDAVLVSGCFSRLLYDLNRPPDAPGAMPPRSEAIEVPGNRDLDAAERAGRTDAIYAPFHAETARIIARTTSPLVVTVHSFTPVYHDTPRTTEVGVLHDSDARLADAMLATAPDYLSCSATRNAPYGPQDGVMHTLQRQGIAGGHPNVMIEIRNDLIATPAEQARIGTEMARWIAASAALIGYRKAQICSV